MRGLLTTAATALSSYLLFSAAERALPLLLAPLERPFAALLFLALILAAAYTARRDSSRRLTRAAGVALALAALLAPHPVADALALAAGTIWLGGVCTLAAPRPLAFGVATGVAVLPAAPALAALPALNAVVALLAGTLVLALGTRPAGSGAMLLERRAPALRRRGLAALGALLLLTRLIRGSMPGTLAGRGSEAELALLAVSALAALALTAQLREPWPRHRRALLLGCGAAVLCVLLAPRLDSVAAVLLVIAHATAVVLVARALVPLATRRSAAWVVLAWAVWLGLAGGVAPFESELVALLPGVVAALALGALPRPAAWRSGEPDAGERALPDVR